MVSDPGSHENSQGHSQNIDYKRIGIAACWVQGGARGWGRNTYIKFCNLEELGKELQNPKSGVPGEQSWKLIPAKADMEVHT